MKVKKKDIQHEDNQTSLSMMLSYKRERKDVDYTPDEIKPMQYTTNWILNQNISHLKNAPIQNSDLKPSTIIRPYSKFLERRLCRDLKRIYDGGMLYNK